MKGFYPVAARFLYGVQQRYYIPESDTHIMLITSLPPSSEAPPPKGAVTATVKVNAWVFKVLKGGMDPRTEVTNYTVANPGGSLPSFVIKLTSSESGGLVGTLRDYILEFGVPIVMTSHGWCRINRGDFSHQTKQFDGSVEFPSNLTDDQLSQTYLQGLVNLKMYPSGVIMHVTGISETDVQAVMVKNGRSENSKWFKISFGQDARGRIIHLTFMKRQGGVFKISLDDKELQEVQDF